jgi:predicted phage replisome organizer
MGQEKGRNPVKRYYWLKLKEEFFLDKEVKKLRKIAGGDTYTIIYLKLMLLSLKTDGKLYFDSIEDTFAEELALEIDEDAENVRVTLMYLEKMNLLQIINEEEMYLTQMDSLILSESESAQRVRRHRAKIKGLEERSDETNLLPMGEEQNESVPPPYDYSKHTNIENVKYVLNNKLFADWEFIHNNQNLWQCIKNWMEYKDLKKPKSSNHYVNDVSIGTLLNKFVSNSKQYGVEAVVDIVNDAMSQCYQGIVWDRIKPRQSTGSNLDNIDIGE